MLCVCQLEKQFCLALNQNEKDALMEDKDAVSDMVNLLKHKDYYSRNHTVCCNYKNCSLHAHSVKLNSDRFIFQIPVFGGMM